MVVHDSDDGLSTRTSGTPWDGGSRSRSEPLKEKLDVPEGGPITNRLAMLKIGDSVENQRLAGGAPSRQSTFGKASDISFGGSISESKAPSLMEQMVAEATSARKSRTQEKRRDQRIDNKTSFRGGGLKKGFLVSAPEARAKKKKQCTVQIPIRGDSPTRSVSKTIAPVKDAEGMRRKPIITVVGSDGPSPSSSGVVFDESPDGVDHKHGLLLPDVQEAMKHNIAPLGGVGIGNDWLTAELLDKISENPRLASVLTHPRFMEAVQLMRTRPQDAIAMFASSSEARDSFTKLMALLAGHFTGMGEAADKQAAAAEAERRKIADGPLAQEALRRAAEGIGVAAASGTAEDKAGVDRVLNQPELRELLMDPSMQRVLQECAEPALLSRYMRHPDYGPKLRLMAQAGLVTFKY